MFVLDAAFEGGHTTPSDTHILSLSLSLSLSHSLSLSQVFKLIIG